VKSRTLGITGANGFIGAHLLRSAIKRGHRPVALIQLGTSLQAISDLEGLYERVYGDLNDHLSLDSFVSQCDELIHLAGFNRYWSKDPTIFHRVNVVGVRSIAKLCLKYRVKKLLHVSSCIALGASYQQNLRNEQSHYNLYDIDFLYGETKKAGEAEIERYVNEENLPAIIVNPVSAIGEFDIGCTPIGRVISEVSQGGWPVYVPGGSSFIDVHDLINGLWLALERGKIGRKYLLVGENISNREFIRRVAKVGGVSPIRFEAPKKCLKVLAAVSEGISNFLTHQEPMLTQGISELVGRYLYYDGSRAAIELGFKAGSCNSAIERSVKWMRKIEWKKIKSNSSQGPVDSSENILQID
jgi:dihydroflavonol-4-reductase